MFFNDQIRQGKAGGEGRRNSVEHMGAGGTLQADKVIFQVLGAAVEQL